ncbi:MAG: alpha/beta hydrolase [Candidatus Marinimicrobia bacterium]|nr:alpha/beta hydrolase [Candidatus Neomarinimicrobiota bacterium]
MKNPINVLYVCALGLFISFGLIQCADKQAESEGNKMETVILKGVDGLILKADVYESDAVDAPVILLFHQARYSRGEYRTIAPRLNQLGFTCIAIDQRSGDAVKGVKNDTYAQAIELGLGTQYIDAYPDLQIALKHVKETYTTRKLIVWGSSYSAALVLVLANEYPADIAGLVAFSPGAYFSYEKISMVDYAHQLTCPVFMTSSREEASSVQPLYDAIRGDDKTFFIPEEEGQHGSKALWSNNRGNENYWEAIESFLKRINES